MPDLRTGYAMGSPEDRSRSVVSLGLFPTPLEPLERLSDYLGGARLWVKRDDCSGLAGGGNKVRKLEFLLGEACRERAEIVLTSGAVQSNHARLTAAACARLGFGCELWLNRRVPGRTADYERSGNALLDRLFNARVELLPVEANPEIAADERASELRQQGTHTYVIPTGGSNAVGACGYVECAHELLAQSSNLGINVKAIVVAMASGGTLAGLAVGLAAAGWTGRLIGAAVSLRAADSRARVAQLAAETAAYIGRPGCVLDLEIDDRWLGEGYGVPTEEGLEAIHLFARLEGLLLDPVYTGKAVAALIALARSGDLPDDGDVVFLHTGGWPALFGYVDDL